MNKENSVLRLINRIDKGLVSPKTALQQVEKIEQEYGPLDLLYDVDDRDDEEYYKELITNAKLGVFNKESIIKMAEIKYKGKPNKTAIIVISGISVIVIIVVIIMALGGKR